MRVFCRVYFFLGDGIGWVCGGLDVYACGIYRQKGKYEVDRRGGVGSGEWEIGG